MKPQKRTVLVVDDDYCMREHLSQLLRDSGFEAIAAANGYKALGVVERVKGLDLVVTDIFMPEREGITLITDLKRDHPRLKILAISGGGAFAGARGFLDAAVALGAHAGLEKPFTDEVFLATVTKLVSGPLEVGQESQDAGIDRPAARAATTHK